MLQLLTLAAAASLSTSIVLAPARPASCSIENRSASFVQTVNVDYPKLAQLQDLTGTAAIRVDLSETGKVVATSVEQSSGSAILDRAAERSAATLQFAPEIRGCVTVPGSYIVQVQYVN